jgi:uncharacterized protein
LTRLKDRLERRAERSGRTLEPPEPPPAASPRSAVIEDLRRRMDKVAARHAPGQRPAPTAPAARGRRRGELPGEVVETEHGPVLVRRRAFSPSHRHGRAPVADFLACGPGLASLGMVEVLRAPAAGRILFLDTETTGLAGGTGTLPFLAGLGWLEPDGGFAVEQLFCREPCEEKAQLHLLAAHLASATALVTFNGRAFDMPLVNTRFVMNRMRNPGAGLPHLDLLLVARRVFGARLADRSLGNLESAVLGFERVGDIPGSAIPGVYADYLRGGPTEPIEAVLEHNALDLVALAALGAVLERMYLDPEAVEHALDHLGLASAAIRAKEHAAAEAHLGLAEGAKGARSHLALAKHYEHKERNYERALEHARECAQAEGEEGAARRIARLERKISRRGPSKDQEKAP